MPHRRLRSRSEKSSQETRGTSTPVNEVTVPLMTSPSISRISSESLARRNSNATDSGTISSSRSNVPRQASRALDSPRSEVSQSSDSDIDINATDATKETTLKPVKWPGAWAALAPRDPESIFGQIMARPGQVQVIAEDWLAKNHRDCKKLVTVMVQFFVDLAGYQDLDVEKFFDFKHSNTSKGLVRIMAGHGGHVEPKAVFCFMKNSPQSRAIETVVGLFLDAWITECLEARLLFDDQIYGHIFTFVTAMTDHTRNKNITNSTLITGAVLVLKLNTATLKAYLRFSRDNNDDRDMKTKRIEELQRQLKHWYTLYQLNIEKFFERPCHMIALKCLEELAVWMELDPAYYVNSMNIKYIMRRVQLDSDNQVCMAAMQTCLKMVEIAEVAKYLLPRLQRYVTGVEGRIRDANPKVQIMAIRIFHKMLLGEWYLNYVTYPICSEIAKEMFNDHNLELAKASANFFITFNQIHNVGDVESLMVFPRLVNELENLKSTNGIKGVEHLTHRLVEACWEYAPQLEHWEYYVVFLLDPDYEMYLKNILLGIMVDVVGYFLTGKISVHRGAASEEKPATSGDHCDLLQTLAGSISELFEVMATPKSMRKFTKILTMIDYSVCPYEMFPEFYESIADEIKAQLEDTRDETVIKNLVALMDALSKSMYFKTNQKLEEIQREYVSKVNKDPQAIDDVLKLAHILSKFDIHRKLKYERCEEKIEENGNLLIVWKWYLVWMLRKIKHTNVSHNCDDTEEADFLSEQIQLFKKYLKMFLRNAFVFLNNNFKTMFLAFEELHSLYTVMNDELKNSDLRKDLFLTISDKKLRAIVWRFLQKTVLAPIPTNAPETLKQKREECFKNYIHLCNFNALPKLDVFVVFRVYKSLYEEYGYIIDGVLEAMDKADVNEPKTYISSLMELFFYDWYKEIMEKDGRFDLQSSQTKSFKSCARGLLGSKVMSKPGYQKQFVKDVLGRFLPREADHAFIYVTIYAFTLWSKSERDEISEYMKERKWTKTPYVALVIKELKGPSVNKPKKVVRTK